MKVLVLNSGSSSQKSCVYEIGDALPDDPPACLWEGKVEWVDEQAHYSIKNSRGESVNDQAAVASRGEAIRRLLDTLWSGTTKAISGASAIDVVGHRVVHGGPHYFAPAMVTAEVKSEIEKVSAFAPLHNRAELEGMEIVAKVLGPVPQVAVFDTGFHHQMPLPAATYPGPYEWFEQGIRRYGFHGINHQYCAERAAQMLGKNLNSLRLITCHLGNGCSLAAIREGRSVDTTMGFTPLEGLMMGTRSGSVDPGILTYLMRQKHIAGEKLDDVLNKKSGLLGISGISGDMRQILAATRSGDERAKARAQLAFDMYVHRLRSGIGAMIAVLGGIDALIFTAGVGENSAEVRAAACENLGFAGVRLDREKNAQSPSTSPKEMKGDADISAADATVRVLVIHAQEDWMIARECWNLVRGQSATA
ncbi:MAG TPA: acetate kinase [Terriglobales bacterium]|jgi:acetate kinase|nr:acetate kinase [Terriglobales bacterium]